MGEHLVSRNNHLLYTPGGHLANECPESEYVCEGCSDYTLPNNLQITFSGIASACQAYPGCSCYGYCKCAYKFLNTTNAWNLTRSGNAWASGWVAKSFRAEWWALPVDQYGCDCGDPRVLSPGGSNYDYSAVSVSWIPGTLPDCGSLYITFDYPYTIPATDSKPIFWRTIDWCPEDRNITVRGQQIVCSVDVAAGDADCNDQSMVSVVHGPATATLSFS